MRDSPSWPEGRPRPAPTTALISSSAHSGVTRARASSLICSARNTTSAPVSPEVPTLAIPSSWRVRSTSSICFLRAFSTTRQRASSATALSSTFPPSSTSSMLSRPAASSTMVASRSRTVPTSSLTFTRRWTALSRIVLAGTRSARPRRASGRPTPPRSSATASASVICATLHTSRSASATSPIITCGPSPASRSTSRDSWNSTATSPSAWTK
mmetsp:Transcript_31604/g.92678  ORF Transcript_31604/g.92678 Transcript_31604/m.92678 type:complete len:213 (+) Transcript_31604:436-1074(+)